MKERILKMTRPKPTKERMPEMTTGSIDETQRLNQIIQTVINATKHQFSGQMGGGVGIGGVGQEFVGGQMEERLAEGLHNLILNAIRERVVEGVQERLETVVHDRLREVLREKFVHELRNTFKEFHSGRFDLDQFTNTLSERLNEA